MLGLCKLPQLFHPIDQYNPLARVTDDAFFLSVEAKDPLYDEAGVEALLAGLGGYNIASVES